MNGIFSIFIPIIVMIIIYSLRQSKSEQSHNQQDKKKYPMPPITNDWFPKSMNPRQVIQDSEIQPMMKDDRMDERNQFDQSVTRQIKEMETISETSVDKVTDDAYTYSNNDSGTKKYVSNTKMVLNRQTVAQGILLSELLGPPRARKPHPAVSNKK